MAQSGNTKPTDEDEALEKARIDKSDNDLVNVTGPLADGEDVRPEVE